MEPKDIVILVGVDGDGDVCFQYYDEEAYHRAMVDVDSE